MNKRQRQKQEKKQKVDQNFIIDVSRRKTIRIEQVDTDKLTMESNLKEARKEFADISDDIKKTYYNSNVVVERVEKRNFFDLLKLFIKVSR